MSTISFTAMSTLNFSQICADPVPNLVVAGSDKIVRVLDAKQNFSVSHELQGHKDVVTSLSVTPGATLDASPLVLSGGGNGWVLVHELSTGQCLYAVGATEKGACTCVEAVPPDHFVAAGADGKLVIFDY